MTDAPHPLPRLQRYRIESGLVHRIVDGNFEYLDPGDEVFKADDVRAAIETALAQARRETWEKAANKPGQHHIDQKHDTDPFVAWMQGYLTCKNDYAEWCRQQAQVSP